MKNDPWDAKGATLRERQMLEAVYQLGKASVAEVQQFLGDDLSYSTVRTLLGRLEKKRLLNTHFDGTRYVYEPAVSPKRARKSSLEWLTKVLFEGSPSLMVEAALEHAGVDLSDAELARLRAAIERARKEEGK